MKKVGRNLMSIVLSVAILLSILPDSVFAAEEEFETGYKPTERSITLSADTDSTIIVEDPEPVKPDEPEQSENGILSIEAEDFSIERDYAQQCMLTVKNLSDKTQTAYFEATNSYADLSLEIIKTGSKNNPVILAPGETTLVELAIFAQNAANTNYSIPITAFVMESDTYKEDAKATVNVNCALPELNLSWTKISEDTSTLTQKYLIQNNGDTLTDLTVSGGNGLEDYVSFSPIISNYELEAGTSVEVSVYPDLAKMKETGTNAIEGTLVASSAGKNSTVVCSFDTNGQEITVTTMGELARKQDGNPFTKVEIVEESIEIRYFEGENYNSVTDDLTINDFLGDDNLLDYTYHSEVDLGVENNAVFDISLKSSVLEQKDSEINTQPIITYREDGSFIIKSKVILTSEEYESYINEIKETMIVSTQMLDKNVSDFENTKISNVNPTYRNQEILEEMPQTVLESASIVPVSTSNKEDPVTKGERYLLDLTFDIDSGMGAFGMDPTGGAIGFLGNLYSICSLIEDYDEYYDIVSNPMIDTETKTMCLAMYATNSVVTLGIAAISIANPVAGFALGMLWKIGDGLIDYYKALVLGDEDAYAKFAAIYEKVSGHQCTNRGYVPISFYVPDYSDNEELQMYATNRMHGDGYVDKTDTNYDITLNGDFVGTVSNTGLTDMSIADIPTDSLNPGEVNELVFDYDTNPGSYFVTADTEITLLYPEDTEIGYIGQPDELQDIRRLPDGAIYPENIYVQDELIANELAMLSFNAYNTGCRGGWFTITVYDGETPIYTEENYYIAAFTGKTFLFGWTPSTETSEITVTLTHTSVNLDEKDSSNNSATKSLTVRQREIPVMGELKTDDLYANTGYQMAIDIQKQADVTGIHFLIDGTEVCERITVSDGTTADRYLLSANEGLAEGEHSVQVVVDYQTSDGIKSISDTFNVTVFPQQFAVPVVSFNTESTLLYGESMNFSVSNIADIKNVELSIDSDDAVTLAPTYSSDTQQYYEISTESSSAGTHTVDIRIYYGQEFDTQVIEERYTFILVSEEDSYFAFSLDDNIEAPQYYLYNKNSVSQSCTVEQQENGSYRLKKTLDMYNNPDDYTFIVKHSEGIVVKKISENNLIISTEDSNTLTFEMNESDQLNYVYIERIDGINTYISTEANNTLKLSAGIYEIYFSANIDGTNIYRTIEVDVSDGNQNINLRDMIKTYYFEMKGSDADDYIAKIYYRNPNASYWSSDYLVTKFDAESRLLSCYLTYESTIAYVEAAEEVRIVISSNSEAYIVEIKSSASSSMFILRSAVLPEQTITLNRDNLNRVILEQQDPSLTLEYVYVTDTAFAVTLYGNVIYLPNGDYNLDATFNTGTQTLKNNVQAKITDDCEIVSDERLAENLTDVTIKWAEQYDSTATVDASTISGDYVYAENFQSGNSIKVENGLRYFYMYLYQGDVCFTLKNTMEVGNNNTTINVGNHFDGKISSSLNGIYEAGSSVNLRLSDFYDENNNYLSYLSAYDAPLHGYVIYTNTEKEDDIVRIPVTLLSSGLTITAPVPEKGGTYYISVELFTYGIEENQEHVHTEVIDSALTATCIQNGLTEGSHCSVCGEVIVAQTVVSAIGHAYGEPTFVWDELYNSRATFTCEICGYTQSIDAYVTSQKDEQLGDIVYSAVIEFEGETYSDIKVVEFGNAFDDLGETEEPVKPSQNEKADSKTTKQPDSVISAVTGDSAQIVIWIGLMIGCAVISVILIGRKKKDYIG